MAMQENIEDKIDFKKIDQLHNATINFSKSSLEIKKLLFVVLGISTPVIISLSNNKLDTSLFVSLYVIVISFWIFDSYTYYYQKKLRSTMDKYFIEIKNRNSNGENEEFHNQSQTGQILSALFNLSHLCFYGVICTIITIVFSLYLCNMIK